MKVYVLTISSTDRELLESMKEDAEQDGSKTSEIKEHEVQER